MTLDQIRTKGTIIPEIINKVPIVYTTYNCIFELNLGLDYLSKGIFEYKEYISYGSIFKDNIEYIKIDNVEYSGKNHFLIPVSELIRIGAIDESNYEVY